MKHEKDFLEYGSVRISDDAIRQLSGSRTVIHVPRKTIHRIELTRKTGAERPIAHIAAGALLVGIAGIGIEMLYTMIAVDGEFAPFRILGLLLMLPVGVWLIATAFIRKTQLYVTMKNDRRKILFDRSSDLQKIQEFIEQARTRFGYAIEDSMTE